MNISKLRFFDKNGEAYNLEYITNGSTSYWYGADYFLPISTALYDVSNIFILEETNGEYHFPDLGTGGLLTAKWKTSKDADNFFLYTITAPTPEDDNSYLTRRSQIEISRAILAQTLTLQLTSTRFNSMLPSTRLLKRLTTASLRFSGTTAQLK